MDTKADITGLLQDWRKGDEHARSKLFDLTYDQLRKIARGMLYGDRLSVAVQPTELVNECAMRLFNFDKMNWQDRAHFVAMATTTMRRVLIDEARRRSANKRDGLELTYVTDILGESDSTTNLDLLDDTLKQLEEISKEKARIVELKYFGGLSNKETAEVMGISESTVKRSWRSARAWLYAELNESRSQ